MQREETDLKRIEDELALMRKNIDYTSELNRTPIGDNGFEILRQLNNQNPTETGIKYFSRNGERIFPFSFVESVRKQASLSSEEMAEQIKILYLKGLIDYQLVKTNIHELMDSSELDITEDEMKMGSGLSDLCESQGSRAIRLTERGLLTIIDHIYEKITLSISTQKEQLKEQRDLANEIKENFKIINSQVKEGDAKISVINDKIGKFNENIFTIFSLMIAAFAVIGINISSIPNIESEFLLNVLAVNLSIGFSLVLLFALLNILIQKEKRSQLTWLLLGFGVLLVIFTYLYLN